MKQYSGLLFCLLFVVLACATNKKEITLEDTLRFYETSIRWGEFGDAQALQKEITAPLDPEKYREIKVISYEVIRQEIRNDYSRLDQTVEIRFYHEQQGKVQKLIDRQTWLYDNEQGIWLLDSDLPDFNSAIQ